MCLSVVGPLCVQVLGLGSVAQVVTGQGAFGEYLSINLGFGLGVAMGVHVGGKVSGMKADPNKFFTKRLAIHGLADLLLFFLFYQGLT